MSFGTDQIPPCKDPASHPSYLDRTNIAVAKLTMSEDLGLTGSVAGTAGGPAVLLTRRASRMDSAARSTRPGIGSSAARTICRFGLAPSPNFRSAQPDRASAAAPRWPPWDEG